MRRALFLVCMFFLMAPLAVAQTKISGTDQCGKNSIEHMIPAGDHPNHSLGVNQGKCTWTKPFVIAGIASKEGVFTGLQEADGDKVRTHGVYVDTMANGDQAHYRYEFTATAKNGQLQVTAHKWQLVGGTGKLKGVKGQGTCKVTPTADGGATYECQGEYTLAK